MTTISDLPGDLVTEILSKLPITSLSEVRSTCKRWNTLSQNQITFDKEATRKQFLGFMMMDYRVCSLRFDFRGIRNGSFDPSIKQIGKFDQVEISQVFHCDGLLLCVVKDNSSLLIWNPYLGQTKWIQPRNNFDRFDRYALGYDSNTHNHKILRIIQEYESRDYVDRYEIYDCSSDSWRVLDITPDLKIPDYQRGLSLNRNTYFLAQEKVDLEILDITELEYFFLVSFDFTTESFGPRLPLPFRSYHKEIVTISCVREEQLAVLFQLWQTSHELEIWVTTKIEPNVVSWSIFLEIDMEPLTGLFSFSYLNASFLIDEEEKVAVVFDLDVDKRPPTNTCRYQTAYIVGQDGYFKSVNIGEAPDLGNNGWYKYCVPLVCSSYVPSLVQLQNKQPGKRKERDY